MHGPIPAESPSRGKPIFVHRAEGYGRFKERVLILEETATIGWHRTSGSTIRRPPLISLAFSASCRVYVAFNPKATFRLRHLLDVIAPRKQVALDIKRHDDRRMTETFLHDLGRKSKASIIDSFHAPRGVKMPQGRKPLFRGTDGLAIIVDFAFRVGTPAAICKGASRPRRTSVRAAAEGIPAINCHGRPGRHSFRPCGRTRHSGNANAGRRSLSGPILTFASGSSSVVCACQNHKDHQQIYVSSGVFEFDIAWSPGAFGGANVKFTPLAALLGKLNAGPLATRMTLALCLIPAGLCALSSLSSRSPNSLQLLQCNAYRRLCQRLRERAKKHYPQFFGSRDAPV